MKITYLFLGIITIGLSILFVKDDFINLKVLNQGHIVNMEIIEKPKSCIGTKVKWFMKVKYGNKAFSKQIPSIFCENHKVGDVIQVRYLEGEDRVLLLNEGVTFGFVASGIFILIGLYVIYHGMTNRIRNRVN